MAGSDSVPQSPIVEMPSTPASNSMMYIEFPDDADNDISYVDEDSNIVEVRITIENSSYAFVLLIILFVLVYYFVYVLLVLAF